MSILQRDLYRQLRADSLASRTKLTGLLRQIDGARINEHPEPEGWSVGQVLEHLCITDEIYDAPLAEVMRTYRPDAGAPAREWKGSFIGRLIAGSLEKPRAIKAPKVFRPGPTPRNGVADAFMAREAQLLTAMEAAESYDWRKVKVASPALPPIAPKMNLGDVFKIHVVHVTRHAKQIERLVAQL